MTCAVLAIVLLGEMWDAAASLASSGEGDMTVAALVGGGGNGGPGVVAGHYVTWVSGDVEADQAASHEMGCIQAAGPSGMIILAFGSQRPGGASAFSGKGVVRDFELLERVVEAFAAGMEDCHAKSGSYLVVSTSNNNTSDNSAASQGRAWGSFVARLGRSVSGATVVGGNDMEPSWGSKAAAVAWRDSYLDAAGAPLVWLASADGCSKKAVGGMCTTGWSQLDLAHVMWDKNNTVVLPQIYSLNGTQARQWAMLAAAAKAEKLHPRFAGALSQAAACKDGASGCAGFSISGDEAWAQLRWTLDANEVTKGLPLRFAADIGWG